ncbi:hypothetical protein ACFY64_29070 [Streptomyces collinus]|uniref:hypothetical protein n=1 Tax=Streptomyces collinus TaxID=42684 RepID=UPI0036AFB480
MDESRQSPAAPPALLRKLVPPPALCGFLLLLVCVFAVSYAVGSAAGPVAPGMHGTGTSRSGDGGGGGDEGDGGMDGMPGMHGSGG